MRWGVQDPLPPHPPFDPSVYARGAETVEFPRFLEEVRALRGDGCHMTWLEMLFFMLKRTC